jgi:hypothetical protein
MAFDLSTDPKAFSVALRSLSRSKTACIATHKLLTVLTAAILSISVTASSFGGSLTLLGMGGPPSVPADAAEGVFFSSPFRPTVGLL